MIDGRAATAAQRAAFCSVHLPRSEQRQAPGAPRAHSVYLVRLESHLGVYPSADTWFELRYSKFHALHTSLRQTHTTLRLPWLPRARVLFGTLHPSYVLSMAEELLRYLQQLLQSWQRAYGEFDGFIELLHALHNDWPLPPPPPEVAPPPTISLRPASGGGGSGSPRGSIPAGGGAGGDLSLSKPSASALPPIDGALVGELLCWREYEEHVERLLDLGVGAAESTAFEEEGALTHDVCHVWRVVGFSVRRVALDDRTAPLKLHTTDAYLLLVPVALGSPSRNCSPHPGRPDGGGGRGSGGGGGGEKAGGGGGRGRGGGGGDRGRGEDGDMGAAGDSAGGPSGDGVTTGWRAHYWIGKQCTADKAGSAAALVVQLSSLASASDGMAVRQVREVEGAESTALLTAFPHLQAVPGGSASGWKARRLIQPPIRMIKVGLASSANIDGGRSGGGGCLGRVSRVAPLATSLGERSAYVVDVPPVDAFDRRGGGGGSGRGGSGGVAADVFQWHGHMASLRVKASALLLAHTIRSIDRRGMCNVHVVGNAELPDDAASGQPLPPLPDLSGGEVSGAAAAAAGAGAGGASTPVAGAAVATAAMAGAADPALPDRPRTFQSGDATAIAAAIGGESASPASPTSPAGTVSPSHSPPRSPPRVRTRSMSQHAHEERVRAHFWAALHQGTLGTPVPPPIPSEPRAVYRLQLLPRERSEVSAEGSRSTAEGGDEGEGGDGGGEDGDSGAREGSVRSNAAAATATATAAASAAAATDSGARLEPPPRLRVTRAPVETRTLHSEDQTADPSIGRPAAEGVLRSEETIVLDCGSVIYVWSGARAGGYLRWAARTLARWLVSTTAAERTGEVDVIRESEGCEGALFRSMFATWHWFREANPSIQKEFRRLEEKRRRLPPALSLESEVSMMRRQAEKLHARDRARGHAGYDPSVTPAPPVKPSIAAVADAAVAEEEAADDGGVAAPLYGGGTDGGGTAADGIDEGSETLNVWLIGAEANLVEVLPEEEHGIFWR